MQGNRWAAASNVAQSGGEGRCRLETRRVADHRALAVAPNISQFYRKLHNRQRPDRPITVRPITVRPNDCQTEIVRPIIVRPIIVRFNSWRQIAGAISALSGLFC
jgi:hypothetical protein